MSIATVNPATGEIVRTFEEFSDAEIEQKISRAAATFQEYRKVPVSE